MRVLITKYLISSPTCWVLKEKRTTRYLMVNAQQDCAYACAQSSVCVCVPAQLKVNSLCLSDFTLKSGRLARGERAAQKKRRLIPDITPVFNAPRSPDNRRSNHLLPVFITKLIFREHKVDILRLSG